jgi:glycerol kinase
MREYIGAIDQGTTSTRFIIFDRAGQILASAQREHRQIYPQPGWVEHDPAEIRQRTREVMDDAMRQSGLRAQDLAAVGISNQRETTVLWDGKTGEPLANAIVWQDTRVESQVAKLEKEMGSEFFRKRTGLPLSTYFSSLKISWLLENIPGMRHKAQSGNILFGNIDAFLAWHLTGGENGGVHVTDVSNASRTQLMNLETLAWDTELLSAFNIPSVILPRIASSSEVYGEIGDGVLKGVPLAGILGDQQAALVGQTCLAPGEAKNTYGTGCFLLMNTGIKAVPSTHGLITTVAYKFGDAGAVYALEGSIAIAGALVQWLRDNLGFFATSAEIEKLAASVKDNGGVYFVPAFSGLYAPYWNGNARGVIAGLTQYANKGHIARAVLEATAFQTRDVVEAMEKDCGISMTTLRVDGGMVVNELLMQFQSDILNRKILRPRVNETTALGAAYAAGLAVGWLRDLKDVRAAWTAERTWTPAMDSSLREERYRMWKKAVETAIDWV